MRDVAAIAALPYSARDASPAASPTWGAGLVWLITAGSSVVFIEPAPYDVLAIGTFAALLLSGVRIPRQLAMPLLLLTLFVVSNWLAAAASPDPTGTLRSLGIRTYLCVSFVLFACAVASAPHRMLRALWIGYAIAALIAVAWGTLQYFGYIPHPDGFYRARGAFKDPNVFGPFLVPIVLWSMERAWQRRGVARATGLALFVTSVFGVLLSFSRGAWLNLLVGALAYFGLRVIGSPSYRSRMRTLVTGIALLALAAGLVSLVVSSQSFSSHFAERARLFQSYDVSTSGRFAAQSRALASASANPLGVGPGRSPDEFGIEPHNLYLHVFSEGGWIAGVALVWLVGLTIAKSVPLVRRAWAFQSQAQIVLAALAGLLMQSFFIDSTHWRHFYLLLGVAWALIAVHSRNAASRSP